ncbi:hypothetical protein EV424DRAFT_1436487 [Suillus variegatus]|nr:hypothetical protein EV424DRAFT_1436487 [Suillus variegatus]
MRQPSQQGAESNRPAFSNEHRTIEPTTSNTLNNHLICFSSDPTHALYDISELMEGASSHDDRSSTPFLLNHDSGWMVGPKHRLLFWVPPASRNPFYSPGTVLVMPRGCTELDLSRMALGQHWQKCRKEP